MMVRLKREQGSRGREISTEGENRRWVGREGWGEKTVGNTVWRNPTSRRGKQGAREEYVGGRCEIRTMSSR